MIDGLNERQKEAVINTDGPLLVLAGAGSGKTKVLTTRIAYLINEKGIDGSNILAITFTNKAAKEMKERVIGMLGPTAFDIQISTFHSFGLLLIKENYSLLGLKQNFTILDSDDSLTIIKKIVKEMGLDPDNYSPKAIRNQISGAKNNMVYPDEYETFATTDFEEVVVKVYRQYQNRLKINNSLDFDDLLLLPIKLFDSNPEVLQKYQEKFKYILVDEYQDTNEVQYILIKKISAKYQNICVVGDNDQSIYSFRGSNYRNILNFEKDYKNAKIVILERNYRSTKTILNAANDVIKNNKQRKEKNLFTENNEGIKIKYYRAYDEKDEAFYVMSQINELIKKGINKSDIAVLYRTNAQSRNIEEALLKENIPYKVVGSLYFYNRKEIKDLLAYLKLIHNSDDDTSLMRIINTPRRGIGLKTIENISIKAELENKSMYEAITSGKELDFKNLIEYFKDFEQRKSLTELVEEVLNKTGLRQELTNEKTMEADIKLENLEEFKTIVKKFEENNAIISLEDFLDEVSLVSDIEEHRNNTNVVTLMTIHSAKGLEFDNVFIVGLEEGIFPHKNSLFDQEQLEEERRLCYVAMTRAKQNLWLVNAKKRTLYGLENINPESRFIKEINIDYLDIYNKQESIDKFNKKIIDTSIVYEIGEHVIHDTYGEGIIVDQDKSVIAVAFSYPNGIKKIIKGHKSIRKV